MGSRGIICKHGEHRNLLSKKLLVSTARFYLLDFFLRQVFYSCELGMRRHSTKHFIQLCLDGSAVAILGILDHEHHKEGHEVCDGIGHQLPCVRPTENGAHHHPQKCAGQRSQKNQRLTRNERNAVCEVAEYRFPTPDAVRHLALLLAPAVRRVASLERNAIWVYVLCWIFIGR